MSARIAILMSGLLLLAAGNVSAQIRWDDRVFVNISGGTQTGSTGSAASFEQSIYDETATVGVSRTVKGSGIYDVTVGRPIWGNLGAAFSFAGRSSKADAQVEASVPDPIFFDRPRGVNSSISGMAHNERWSSFLAAWFVPAGEKLDLLVLAGPAVVAVQHDVPSAAAISESASGPVVTLSVDRVKKSFAGYQIGADLRYLITDQIGVGGFVRYVGASGTIDRAGKLELGGAQIGAGIRFRY